MTITASHKVATGARVAGLTACVLALLAGAPWPPAFAQQGDSAPIARATAAVSRAEKSADTTTLTGSLITLATQYRAAGLYRKSQATLDRALALVKTTGTPSLKANILLELSDLYLIVGRPDSATRSAQESVDIATGLDDKLLLARALNSQGNVLLSQRLADAAAEAYRRAARLAATDPEMRARASINLVHAELGRKDGPAALHAIQATQARMLALPESAARTFNLVSLAVAALRLASDFPEHRSYAHLSASALLNRAARDAASSGNIEQRSYALGYLGQIYWEQKQYRPAEKLTRAALFLAQSARRNESLYRWQWQLGRIFKAKGQQHAALAAYRKAVATLGRIRGELGIGFRRSPGGHRAVVAPLFFELADLLLQDASNGSDQAARERLIEARDTVELLKAAELEDYFRDDCVVALQSRTSGIDAIAPHTAVLYLIPLEDRLEILLSLSSGLKRVSVPVSGERIKRSVTLFRLLLEARNSRRYIRPARDLFDWIVKPVQALLEANRVDTLVFVPHGLLYTVPMAALYDRRTRKHLVESYAVAVSPGLKLTAPRAFARANAEVLLGGLSASVSKFAPLPGVEPELKGIGELFDGSPILLNRDFLLDNLTSALQKTPFQMVHLASHAQFSAEPADTFLLSYDGRIAMDDLQGLLGLSEFREKPVELLALSACQTAAGDQRAALGMAGLAVKAGVRSALATLWFVDDRASSKLMLKFYGYLKQPDISKVQALQQAQIAMLHDRTFHHPAYWAPFLMIGNWL